MPNTDDSRRDLVRQELSRVDGCDPAALSPISKHLQMGENPFRFLRGAAQLFYADIRAGRLALPGELSQGVPLTRIMGDCHVSNFGFLTEGGSFGEEPIFCPNDYDDACVGPAVWDLARFCVSLFLGADYCRGVASGRYRAPDPDARLGLRAPGPKDTRAAAHAFLSSYRRTCKRCAAEPQRRLEAAKGFGRSHALAKPYRKARRRAAGGRDFETRSALAKAICIGADGPRFRERPDRYERLSPERAACLLKAFRPYMDDAVLDLVKRHGAGTGSLDMDRYYFLVGPRDFDGSRDLPLCHLVEIKQQRPAAPLFHFPDICPINEQNPAHLTVDCQRHMQRQPDLVLDEVLFEDAHWLVRSRHHARVGIDPEDAFMAKEHPERHVAEYAEACGKALALAHARGDRRSVRFEKTMARVLPLWSGSLLDRAEEYANQMIEDHGLMREMTGAP